jgi:DNA repair exonuclease SbcCD nuclease subunit
MVRLLHTADVHLGARHEDLGDAASALRDRQQASLRAAVDLALAEGVDAVVISGDLFDDNTVSGRTVSLAVAELERLAAAHLPVVLLPGCHDAYTRSSVYRAHDLPALVGATLTVLTPERPWVHLEGLDAVVVGLSELTGSGTIGDLDGPEPLPAATWRIGLLHAAVGDGPDDASPESLEASGVDAVLLGHAHIASSGRVGKLVWAAAGAPEQVAADRDRPGTVNLVTLDEVAGGKHVAVETRVVGTTRHGERVVDVATIGSQAELVERLNRDADPGLILDVRLVGQRADELVVDPDEVETALRGAYLLLRVEDRTVPPLTAGALPPPETIAGAFIRNVEGRIADLEASGGAAEAEEASELREVLRLGRRLLAGAEVAP